MLLTKQEIAHLAIDTATKAGVPPAIVCAIIEVSSNWNAALEEWQPEPWLLSIHPNDFAGGIEQFVALGTRWGVMQFHGNDLRRYGYQGKFSAELLEPAVNLQAGCWLLKQIMANTYGLKATLIKWYGYQRRELVNLTMALVPRFEEFVAARPLRTAVSG